jgi:phosphatidylserine decarboxylase
LTPLQGIAYNVVTFGMPAVLRPSETSLSGPKSGRRFASCERVWVWLFRIAPLSTYTRLIGAFSRIPLPRKLRAPVLRSLADSMGVNLLEAELPLGEYRSFQDLFVRKLRPGARTVDPDPSTIVSPVDGTVSELGPIEGGRLLQVKGVHYTLGDLLEDTALADRFEGGSFVTLYLSPRDYHRIHSPSSGRVSSTKPIGGRLLPVKPFMVRGHPGLFVENERLIVELETERGKALLVCVAAAGVGHISLASGGAFESATATAPVSVEKGQEVAAFNLGSTVVLVLPPGTIRLEPLSAGQEIRMGQVIARSVDGGATGCP